MFLLDEEAKLSSFLKMSQSANEVPASTISSDAAIDSPEKDLLGRNSFAQQLAETLRTWKTERSLVLALNGPWGSGKSSLWRLARWHLTYDQHHRMPPLIEFPLWEISGAEALATSFFTRVSAVLAEAAPVDDVDLGTIFRRYGQHVARGLGLAANLAEAADELGISPGGLWKKGLKAAVGLLPGTPSRKELEEQLRNGLRRLQDPLIVVLDDIDRLTADEIGLLFRLIKANVDFPNLIFLLLFDRAYVALALDTLARGRGEEFVEKIVQVSLDVPVPSHEAMWHVLRSGVQQVIKSLPQSESFFDEIRADQLLNALLGPMFRNLRDVRRYLNSLHFHARVHLSNGVFQVDPVDLAALEALRIFTPQLYASLPANRHLLLRPRRRSHRPNTGDDPAAAEFERLLDNVPTEKREAAQRTLDLLFPHHSGRLGVGSDDDMRRTFRVGLQEYFDSYFQFRVTGTSLTRTHLQEFFHSASQKEALVGLLRRHLEAGTLPDLNLHLNARIDELKEHRQNIVAALFDLGDEIAARHGWAPEYATPEISFEPLILSLFLEIEDSQLRADEFLGALRSASSLHMVWDCAARELFRHESNTQINRRYLVPVQRESELKGVLCDKFTQYADERLLIDGNSAPFKLFQWGMWCGWPASRNWVKRRSETAAGFIEVWRLIRSAPLGEITRSEDVLLHPHIRNVLDVDELCRRRHALDFTALTDNDRELLVRFDNAAANHAAAQTESRSQDDPSTGDAS